SMATPHAAGIAALWAERQLMRTGSLTSETLTAVLLASAKFIPGAEFQDIGNGLIQAPQS
ncbi:MAG: peptidase S8, partial [Moraxellaceae bacterium]